MRPHEIERLSLKAQLVVLSAAANREDRSILPLPASLKGGAAAKVVDGELRRRFLGLDTADVDGWFAGAAGGLLSVVLGGFDVTAGLAASFLLAHASNAGVTISPVHAQPDRTAFSEVLRIMGPVAFKTSIAQTGDAALARRVTTVRAVGAARRLVLGGARDTSHLTIAQSPAIVGYRRETRGKPCAFCAMLASRGAVYKSESIAGAATGTRGTRDRGERYHDSCHCQPVPVYSHDSTPAPYAAEWSQAKRLAREQGVAPAVAFRRLIEGRSEPATGGGSSN